MPIAKTAPAAAGQRLMTEVRQPLRVSNTGDLWPAMAGHSLAILAVSLGPLWPDVVSGIGDRPGGKPMAIAVRNEGDKINSNINVTPMVDVMLVLLIIFMVITPMITPHQIRLPKANNPLEMPEADKEDALLVAVNRDGKVFFGNDQILPADLTARIKERMGTVPDRKVFVRADARVHYKAVVQVVDDVRSAGVSELALLTERKRDLP